MKLKYFINMYLLDYITKTCNRTSILTIYNCSIKNRAAFVILYRLNYMFVLTILELIHIFDLI